ncbi:MAG: ArsR family transcriptional regulator [Candidatus Bathyarchaeota archaeon]|uniref:LexA family protein n=1 Tax=Candidatus Bathycorpusculum sp. TaxID=2994959 RepID=UPI002839BBF1|nr:ArsR family transcriptional regulator [Candidatus Termiticorpusculum sp.]MCL2256630.1 ArsR family transcriptional regulator [Candidatus Termiticorpusculum sp.]MCL2293191.1 ArsR family transcriptional regulator [Candidatus Termiticorpusculum sp.]
MNKRKKQTDKDTTEPLQGTQNDVYRFILTHNKRVGIREIARELDMSSPSVAQHHLNKLEEMELIKREWGGYVINKIVLRNHIKINRFLIPRSLLYLLFSISALIAELILYPDILYHAYAIALITQTIIITFFAYETTKIYRDKVI